MAMVLVTKYSFKVKAILDLLFVYLFISISLTVYIFLSKFFLSVL